MATQIQLRRGISSEWTTANPILAEGEMGIETDTLAYKIGDGILAWSSLPYRELSGFMLGLLQQAIADPSAPAADHLITYAKNIAGRIMPKWIGPSGLDTAFQPAIFANGMQILSPGTSTLFSVIGMAGPIAVVLEIMRFYLETDF